MEAERGIISYQLREFVLERDEYACRYCGSKDGPFHLDHVYPVVKGGETTADNLVTSCVHCNAVKHSSIGMWPRPVGYFDEPDILFHMHATGTIFVPLVFSLPGAFTMIYRTVNVNGGCAIPPLPYDLLMRISGISLAAGLLIGCGIWLGWRLAAVNLRSKLR